MSNVTDSVTAKGTQMLSQTVAREVRAELGRQSISHKVFAEKAQIPYKKALLMIRGERSWELEQVDAAAAALGVNSLDLIFPDRAERTVEATAA
jgi:hypothetical protein